MLPRTRYLQKLIDYMWDGQVKVITGLRRCGKSVLLFDLFFNYLLSQNVKAENIIRIELDKRADAKYRNPNLLADFVETQIKDSQEAFYL